MKPYRVHVLKAWPEPFAAVVRGVKRFEVRKDDRGFEVGDRLVLREYEPIVGVSVNGAPAAGVATWEGVRGSFTGRVVVAEVPYLLRGPAWGLPAGLVVMSLDVQVCMDLGDYEGAWEAFVETYMKTGAISHGNLIGEPLPLKKAR